MPQLSHASATAPFGALLAACSCAFFSTGMVTEALEVSLPSENTVRPYRGLTYTESGIRDVRRIARESKRGRVLADEILKSAQPWLALSPSAVRDLVPSPDATFASGRAGDPKTDQNWPSHARGSDMCTIERPGTVKSPHTGDIYGNAAVGKPYHDPGDGWVRPRDGKRFYFKGIWNSWIVRQLHAAVDNLALAYMLTGNEDVARRGLLILDELACLKAERGEEPGFIDGSAYGATNKHFLAYSGNGANKRIFETVLSVDLLAGSDLARAPSHGNPDTSILETLRDHYFGVYELSYKKSRHTLYNHTTVLFANQLAQAVLFGRPDDLAEGLDVIAVWLEQCLTRDGQYYENAGGYERVGVNYAATMMLPLENYNPRNYEDPAAYPDPRNDPFSLRFGNDPRWYSAAYLMKYRMMACGRMIAFGDMWEDRLVIPGRTRDWDPRLWCSFARLLSRQTDNPEWKEEICRRYWILPEEVRNEAVLANIHGMGMSQWLEPARPKTPAATQESLLQSDSDLIPGKMIALMRSGEGVDQRTAFMCGSVHYSHGHDDQMALILYAKGMCLTGSYGYPAAGSPAHRGWSIKPASHWTMVVNEDLPAPKYPAKNAPSASLRAWVPGQNGFPFQMVEMSNPLLWRERIARDTTEYRRLVCMVDVSEEDFYCLDIFRATGGRGHDYFWTGQWLDQADSAAGFAVQGIDPESIPGVWSLAGLNRRYRDATYNRRGQSWGERLENGGSGKIRSVGIPDEKINVDRYWNPPPENGYGFIYDVRRQHTQDNWSATWDLIDRKNTMRLTFVNNEPQQAMTAKNPAAEANRHHTMVIARRTGKAPLQSRFVALLEAAPRSEWPVMAAERLNIDPDLGVGVRLFLNNGSTDTVLTGTTAASDIAVGDVRLRGARAFVRQDEDGVVTAMMLHEGNELRAGTLRLAFDEPNWSATVIEVIPSAVDNQVVVDAALPAGEHLRGRPVIFSGARNPPGPAYLQDETYRIQRVETAGPGSRLHVGQQRIVASTVVVDTVAEDGAVTSTWPNEIRGGRFADTGTFTGRRVAVSGEPDRATWVESYPSRKTFYPVKKGLFQAGDKLEFHTIQKGDLVRMPRMATLRRTGPDEWELRTTGDVLVTLPAEPGQVLRATTARGTGTRAKAQADSVECHIPVARTDHGAIRLRLTGTAP